MSSRNLESWMWAEACELLDKAERRNRQFFRPVATTSHRALWEPPIDIYETSEEVVVLVALPGVTPAEVQVHIDMNILSVAGERRLPFGADATIHRLEVPYGRFERRVELSTKSLRLNEYHVANGCLVIRLRKQ